MNKKELMQTLELEAKSYRRTALDSVRRSRGSGLTEADAHKILGDVKFAQRFVDAILADFIAKVGHGQGIDWEVRVMHLKEKK